MRSKIAEDANWETLCESTGLQGFAMVAVENRVYRIGGFAARNKTGRGVYDVDNSNRVLAGRV